MPLYNLRGQRLIFDRTIPRGRAGHRMVIGVRLPDDDSQHLVQVRDNSELVAEFLLPAGENFVAAAMAEAEKI